MWYFKLSTSEKIATDEKNFKDWLYNTGDDYVICYGDSQIPIYVKKDKILLGFILNKEKK